MRRLIAVLALCLIPALPHAQLAQLSTPTGLNQRWIAFNRAGAPNSNTQCYNPSQVTVSGGFLTIAAILQTSSCASIDLSYQAFSYLSGHVAMRSFNFLYGTVEYRAKFGPSSTGGQGQWPAVWMLSATCQPSDPEGTDNACTGDEIDISEFLDTFTTVNEQIHVNSDTHNDQCSPTVTDASLNYHVYDLVWSAGSLVFYIDGTQTCSIVQAYVPSTAQYVKAVYSLGGQGGGTITNGALPWAMSLDYLKVGVGCSGVNPMSGCSSIPFDDEFNGL